MTDNHDEKEENLFSAYDQRESARETREWEALAMKLHRAQQKRKKEELAAARREMLAIAENLGASDPRMLLQSFLVTRGGGPSDGGEELPAFVKFLEEVRQGQPELFRAGDPPEPLKNFRKKPGMTREEELHQQQEMAAELKRLKLTPPMDSTMAQGSSLARFGPPRTPEEQKVREEQNKRLRAAGIVLNGPDFIKVGPPRTH